MNNLTYLFCLIVFILTYVGCSQQQTTAAFKGLDVYQPVNCIDVQCVTAHGYKQVFPGYGSYKRYQKLWGDTLSEIQIDGKRVFYSKIRIPKSSKAENIKELVSSTMNWQEVCSVGNKVIVQNTFTGLLLYAHETDTTITFSYTYL